MTAYFFRLEKTQAKFNSILQLNIQEKVTTNKQEISQFCYTYYSNLYINLDIMKMQCPHLRPF